MLFRSFVAFVRKEVYHIFRDPRTLAILFGLPVILVFLFGYTVTNEFTGASIAVVDKSRDGLSAAFVEHLTASGHFEVVASAETARQLDPLFERGAIKMAVVIPEGLEDAFYRERDAEVQLIADASEPNYASTLTSYAQQMIAAFERERAAELPMAVPVGQGSTSAAKPYRIGLQTRMLYNPLLISSYNFIPGVAALILMLISAMMTSLTIAREKETGTMDLLLVSPLPPVLIVVGKVTPYAVLAFVDTLLVFAIGHYMFDLPILGSLPLLLGVSLLYLLVALALGILISTRAATQQVAMMTSLFTLLMPTMLLSGFLFPIASMPTPLQYVSKIIPATYFIGIEQALMLKGAGWEVIGFGVSVLAAMLLVLLGASLRNFKTRYAS